MDRTPLFNDLFAKRIDYSSYRGRSDRQRGKMDAVENVLPDILRNYQDILEYINIPLKVICFAENWCGDCANAVPVIAEIARLCDKWEFGFIGKDDHIEEFRKFYKTAGKEKIPVVVFADLDGNEVARWVERPAESYKVYRRVKDLGLPKEEFIQKLRESKEFSIPGITELIVKEILETAYKSAAVLKSLA